MNNQWQEHSLCPAVFSSFSTFRYTVYLNTEEKICPYFHLIAKLLEDIAISNSKSMILFLKLGFKLVMFDFLLFNALIFWFPLVDF